MLTALPLLVLAVSSASAYSSKPAHRKLKGPGYVQMPVQPCGTYSCVSKIGIGTPKRGQKQQQFSPLLDTGSGNLWVPAVSGCKNGVQFDVSKSTEGTRSISSTETLNITYNSGVSHTGYVAILPVTFAASTSKAVLKNVEVGGATNKETTCSTQGMMGVGVNVGGLGVGGQPVEAPSVLTSLVSSCLTYTRAFSLFLSPDSRVNGPPTSQGRIIFGGVDKSLFVGPLKQVPVYNSQAWYWVKQDSVSLNNGKSSVALYTAPPQGGSFLLDSGSPGMLLSPELGEAIATSLGGERIPHVTGDWAYSCNFDEMAAATKVGKTIDFRLGGGIVIKVRPSSLVISVGGQCRMMIKDSSGTHGGILGDAVVFDGQYLRLAIAQANEKVTKKTKSQIKLITDDGGKGLLPFAVRGEPY